MKRLFSIISIISFILFSQTFAQLMNRTALVRDPSQLERGFGGIVAGVDFDGDGLPEIYACNTNMVDGNYELVPRLYKFEWNPVTSTWDSVWGVTSDIPLQNTWPALTWGDLDNDGKPEIIWGPTNYPDASLNRNPARVIVYEYPGDGSDNMGVNDGFGGFLPNAKTTIVQTDMFNLRPIKFIVADIDNDSTQELIFADRAASSGNYHVGVLSVDNIPDDGSGTETWTTEFSGVGDFILAGTGNKWDLVVVPPYILLFNADGRTFLIKYDSGSNTYIVNNPQSGIAGNNSSFKGSVFIPWNGDVRVLVGSWFTSKVYNIDKDDNVDTLLSHEIADFSSFDQDTATHLRLNGAGFGDVDGDGNPDMIFGTRGGTSEPNAMIFRLEYIGGPNGDWNSPQNYVASVVDSAIKQSGGDYDVICVANVDGDPESEVLYTQGYTRSDPNDDPVPIVILDYYCTPISVEKYKDLIPASIYLDQNYPNPFNPSTTIKFGVTKATNVDIRVFDMLGREVAVIVDNQFMEAGNYSAKFNGEGLASGVYMYQLKAGDATIVKKMQLIK
ncbi:MAG: T9SS type A sorting domain-containing protein [Ignavibacterium sp.]|uniref:T9SS type A sorting domain-containing protein n=1 Tax=Ignavibacterium sp. TaxID=2651167 RepID=UPI00404AC37D